MTATTLTRPTHTVTTSQGERHVHGAGTAFMWFNFEKGKGRHATVEPYEAGFYEPKSTPESQRVAVIGGQGLHLALQSVLLEGPRSNHQVGYAVDHAGPAAPPAHDGSFSGPAATLPVDAMSFSIDDVEYIEEITVDTGVDLAARRYELEGMTAKALRPIASGLGVKGARIMAKTEMVESILDAEWAASK